ncbi:methyltransferase domain-containing protein [Chryseobacterium mulctrae]
MLDLGCGRGRLLNFATHGVDFSQEMLNIAQEKFPYKQLNKLNFISR